jgi:uncharacterized protein (DUF427 family)
VSLTAGGGPLSGAPRGTLVPPMPEGATYVEPFARRVRGLDGDRVLVDSERAVLVHRPGTWPVCAFPADDVRGLADAAVRPVEPTEAAPGYVIVDWNAVPTWFEEDQPMRGHPRNPYHRVDCVRSRRRVRVEVAGEVIVDTDQVMLVDETGHEPRYYVPRDAVRTELIEPSDTTTYCPYKGDASYWTAVVDGERVVDVAWSYDDPLPECIPIAGMLCFYDERAAVSVGWE